MTHRRFLTGILASLALSGSGTLPVSAFLPAVEKKPWAGYYAVFANKHFQFLVTTDGQITLTPIGDRGDPLAKALTIPIEITVQETSPEGKITSKKIKLESLESKDSATDKLVKTTIHGKITGDASFEVVIEQQHNVISIGGRLLEPGTLKKDQLGFSISVKIPDPYLSASKAGMKEQKSFKKIIDKDRVDLKWADGKRKKAKLDETVAAITKEGNGAGITSAEIDISSYKGKKIELVSTPNATMSLPKDVATPLYEGFTMVWTPDVDKDPDGKARLSFEVK